MKELNESTQVTLNCVDMKTMFKSAMDDLFTINYLTLFNHDFVNALYNKYFRLNNDTEFDQLKSFMIPKQDEKTITNFLKRYDGKHFTRNNNPVSITKIETLVSYSGLREIYFISGYDVKTKYEYKEESVSSKIKFGEIEYIWSNLKIPYSNYYKLSKKDDKFIPKPIVVDDKELEKISEFLIINIYSKAYSRQNFNLYYIDSESPDKTIVFIDPIRKVVDEFFRYFIKKHEEGKSLSVYDDIDINVLNKMLILLDPIYFTSNSSSCFTLTDRDLIIDKSALGLNSEDDCKNYIKNNYTVDSEDDYKYKSLLDRIKNYQFIEPVPDLNTNDIGRRLISIFPLLYNLIAYNPMYNDFGIVNNYIIHDMPRSTNINHLLINESYENKEFSNEGSKPVDEIMHFIIKFFVGEFVYDKNIDADEFANQILTFVKDLTVFQNELVSKVMNTKEYHETKEFDGNEVTYAYMDFLHEELNIKKTISIFRYLPTLR